MHRAKAFVKKTRGGKVMKVVREHYLRDDLPCGIVACTLCTPSSSPKLDLRRASAELCTVYVVDTNVVLHQMDLLESRHGVFELLNLVLLQTVVEEVRANSLPLHGRLLALAQSHAHCVVFSNEHHQATYVEKLDGESPNDRNDRAIRTAALWYAEHVQQQPRAGGAAPAEVVMMTEDRGNREKALAEGLASVSITEFVQARAVTHPALVELLASVRSAEKERQRRSEWVYAVHLSAEEAQRGLLSGALRRGVFKVSRDYWAEATVRAKGAAAGSIFIPDLQAMNRAVDGDEVAVELLPQSQWRTPSTRLEPLMDEQDMVSVNDSADQQPPVDSAPALSPPPSSSLLPTGRVVAVLRRHWRSYCGSLDVSAKSRGSFLFLAVNRRIPKIRIQSQQGDALMSKRIQVAMDSWPADSRYPLGHYVSTIGDIGDKDTETTVLLIEHDIPTAPWTNAVLACLPEDTQRIRESDCVGRVDYRKVEGVHVFSIDPPGCTDIDDALHVRALDDGHFEVGVHIADVAHYVQPESALDLEAAHRGTSVYLVDRRIDMLPSMLSTNLCSLKSGVDRLTFSVTWEMTADGDIVNTHYHRAVIRSVASFTYQQAQDRIDATDTSDPITVACKRLNAIAKRLKARRVAAGALMLASQEVRFLLDTESQKPTDVEMYVMKEANGLVEEFMLLANITVAQRIVEYYPTFSLLRRHPTPSADNFRPLVKAAAVVGIPIRVDSSRLLADSLDAAVIPGFPYFNRLIRILATRCMTQAVYFSSGEVERSEYRHYGLAAPIYTHFTSPIRRYADIVVHRLLAASLHYTALPQSVESRERMNDMAETINHRHRMAQLVSRASAELYTLIFFAEKGEHGERQAMDDGGREDDGGVRVVGRELEEDAIIVNVRSTGVRVMIPRYGIEGSITLHRDRRRATEGDDGAADGAGAAAAASEYAFDEERMAVSGPRGVFRIFEQVRARVCVKERRRRRWLSVELMEQSGQPVISRGVDAVDRWKQRVATEGPRGTTVPATMDADYEKTGEAVADVLVVEDELEDGDGHAADATSVKRRRVFHST